MVPPERLFNFFQIKMDSGKGFVELMQFFDYFLYQYLIKFRHQNPASFTLNKSG
jgi:hypothetical protein